MTALFDHMHYFNSAGFLHTLLALKTKQSAEYFFAWDMILEKLIFDVLILGYKINFLFIIDQMGINYIHPKFHVHFLLA